MPQHAPITSHHHDSLQPSPDLLGKVMARIRKERRIMRIRIAFFSIVAFCSLYALFPAFGILKQQLDQSGAGEIASLMFGSPEVLLIAWSELMFFVLESFPFAGMMAILAILFVFLWSLKVLARDVTSVFAPSRLTHHR